MNAVGPIRVRDAVAADAEQLVAFNAALAWESEGKRIGLDVLAPGVARALRSPALCRYFVAQIDAQVVGQTMVTFELTDWRDGLIYWIQSVYVLPEARQKKVYTSLYQHVRNVASADPSARGLRLYVEHDNKPAITAYERLGMQRAPYLFYDAEV